MLIVKNMHLESPAPAICEKWVCLILKSCGLGFELQIRAKDEKSFESVYWMSALLVSKAIPSSLQDRFESL